MLTHRKLYLFLMVTAALLGGNAIAQEITPTPEDFGSASNFLMIPGAAFVPSNGATGFQKPFLFLRRTGGGDSEFTHTLTLPPGALIESVTAYVTDTSASTDVTLRMCTLFATTDTGAGQDLNCDSGIGLPPVVTSGTPGQTALVMNVNKTFNNLQNGNDMSYIILVHLAATDGSQLLHSVRVKWRRQVSAAPATATFADVPTTHAFFRFVEALAASGITGGCGSGNFCPDNPITRGQMAVFLASALGLHAAP